MQNPALDEAYVFNPKDPLPLGDASIDVIVSDVTFEHIVDPAQAARELDRVLKHGGWLCARTPIAMGTSRSRGVSCLKQSKRECSTLCSPRGKKKTCSPPYI
jgi:ubiquinone/menaquinone biosynthesis C-methylase UbiE